MRVSAYVLVTFGPTSAATFAQAQDILVNFRIPHHARPDLWLDAVAVLQVAWVVLALLLVWQTRLFPVLAVPFFLGVLLTLVQVITGSNTLALSRIRFTPAVQEQLRQGDLAGALAQLRQRHVTHLVLPAGQDVHGGGLEKIHADRYYQVYRLRGTGSASGGR